MRKTRGASRLLVIVSIVATGLGLAAPPAAAAPGLTVTPATGLLDQSIVTVTGTGLTPDEPLVVAQCAGAVPAGCDLDPAVNTTGAYAAAGSDGTISVTLRLSRVLALDGGDVSCAVVDCAIVAVTRTEEPTERARAAIGFAATGTAPSPDASLSLAVTGMRARGGRVAYTGSGYLPWFRVSPIHTEEPLPISLAAVVGVDPGAYLALCTPPPSGWAGCERYVSPLTLVPGSSGAAFRLTQWMRVSASGTVSDLVRDMPRMWATDDGRVDCAVEDCSFALEQEGAPHSNVADVAWLPEWAPWPSASAFVTDVYRGLLGRSATASERSPAITGLRNRSLTGFDLLLLLAGQSDARPLAELTRLYRAALGRAPDGPGLLYWERELRRTGSMSAIASAFGRSPEFRQVFGSVSDAQAVTLAYERTLGRTPAPAERDYWVGRLRAGLSRTHLIHLFSRTPEYLARETGRSQATAVMVALLGRGPTGDEWWLMGPDWIIRDNRTSAERVDDAVLDILSSDQLIAAVS